MSPGWKAATVAIFLLTYVAIIVFYHRKGLIIWAGVLLLVALPILPLRQALAAINWNVVLLYFGMLFVGEVFLYSKMPDYLAMAFASRAKRVRLAMVAVCALSGLLSVFLENVAVVLLVAPIAMAIARKCEVSPVPLFIGIAISSNLQGAATLIGDPPSMLLAGFAKITFNDFFIFHGKPGIFFAVQLGALASAAVLYVCFRKYNKPMPALEKEHYISLAPSLLVLALIGALAIGSSFDHGFELMAGALCCVFGAICFAWYAWHSERRELRRFFSSLDWQTGLFLIGVFVLVESLDAAGVMNDVARAVLRVAGGSPFAVFLFIVWISVLLSAFVDNVPFLVAMLPVIKIVTAEMHVSPHALYFGLLIGASVGGNITPIGASANIVAMGILKKQGHRTRFVEFVKIGLPFTLAAVTASSLFVWLVFG